MLRIRRDLVEAMVGHARRDHPDEACGVLAGPVGSERPERFIEMTNAERSPVIYRMEPAEQLRVFNEMERDGLDLVAIYHSHTRSPAYPSTTDVQLAYYPEAFYLIVSLRDRDNPDLRAFRITDGKVEEVGLDVS